MGISKEGFLSGAALAIALNFLTSCTALNVNDSEHQGNSSGRINSIKEETKDATDKAIISKDVEATSITPAVDSNLWEGNMKTRLPFSDAVGDAVEKAKKQQPIYDSPLIQNHQEPEEP